eukprot:316471_1
MSNSNCAVHLIPDEFCCYDDGIDMNCILDIVLDDLEDILLSAHIPPNTSWSTTNSTISPINSTHNNGTIHNTNNICKFPGDTDNLKPELKDHVFISKDCTYRLSQYIIRENWGKHGVLLYKYLDYIFRCQLFDKQVIKVTDHKHNTQYLIFHTGLKRQFDNEYLYVLLYPNYISVTHKNKQKWRVQFGDISNSFISKHELIIKLKQSDLQCDIQYLPHKTIFYESLSDCIYNPMYAIKVSWEERLITNQDRIYKVIGNKAFFDKKRKHFKLTTLINAFEIALNKTKQMLLIDASIVVSQGFVDTKRKRKRMELLLPVYVHFNGKLYTFALAIALVKENNYKYYCVKSVLTLRMAYANARLIGCVNSNWLRN